LDILDKSAGGKIEAFSKLRDFLEYTLHELPAGVLYGANGATEEQCAELMRDTYRLEQLATAVGEEISDLLQRCRWHYERYPHYLSRQRHFGSYEAYMVKYGAPGVEARSNISLQRP
jgi:hypothetical protein